MRGGEVAVWLFVAVHLLLPASYYLLPSSDEYDQQYMWRMFSVTSCATSRVVWTRFENTTRVGDAGTAIGADALRAAGVHRSWREVALGYQSPGKGGAAPRWLVARIAAQLCDILPGEPAAVAAQRTIAPFASKMYTEPVHQWHCVA